MPRPLSPQMQHALKLLREHGQLIRHIDSSDWTPNGESPFGSNIEGVTTHTINALKRRGLVETDLNGMSMHKLMWGCRPPDQRARLTTLNKTLGGSHEHQD